MNRWVVPVGLGAGTLLVGGAAWALGRRRGPDLARLPALAPTGSGLAHLPALAPGTTPLPDVSTEPLALLATRHASVISGFGPRTLPDPIHGGTRTAFHAAVDLGAAKLTPVRAPAPGVVTHVWSRLYRPDGGADYSDGGRVVELRHDGLVVDGHATLSRYLHLTDTAVVPGQRVAAGDLVGRVGETQGLSLAERAAVLARDHVTDLGPLERARALYASTPDLDPEPAIAQLRGAFPALSLADARRLIGVFGDLHNTHLHFEVEIAGVRNTAPAGTQPTNRLDPLAWLRGLGVPIREP